MPRDDARAVRRRARCLYTPAEVDAAIGDMAARISECLSESDPVVLSVMQGGVFTAVELCRRFDFPYRFDYVHVSRYADAVVGGALEWRVRPAAELAGATVLLVDDVLDRGMTLGAVQQALERTGVAALYTAVLVAKDVPREAGPRVDFSALAAGPGYLIGSGMDYRGYWRGLPGVHVLEPVTERAVRGHRRQRARRARLAVLARSPGKTPYGPPRARC